MSVSLEAATDPTLLFARVIERLREGGAGYFGVTDPEIEIERYMSRPYSLIAKVRVTNREPQRRSVGAFVKMARPAVESVEARQRTRAQVTWAFEMMKSLHQQMGSADGFSVVKPIACFPEELTIVTEEVKGATLLDVLEANASWWPAESVVHDLQAALARVGKWLAAYQRLSPTMNDRMTPGEIREYLDVRLRILVDHRVFGINDAQRFKVLRAFDARMALVAPERLASVPVHADFAPGNVLVSGTDIVVLDFAVPARGLACHDVAHLDMQLGLLEAKPKFRPAVVRALQRALLAGFDRSLDTADPLFELLTLQHVVCHYAGLLRSGRGPVERAYNWYLQRRHERWLDAFAARA